MKILTLHINDSIYEKVRNFLVLLPSDKIKIKEQISSPTNNTQPFTYNEFEKKWAGFLSDFELDENWKENRIEHLNKKHA